jgi:MFS family permease
MRSNLLETKIFNVFGWPFTSLDPVIARETLALPPAATGVLAGMDGLGSLLGALTLGLFVRPAMYARVYLAGIVTYLVMLTLFALAPGPWLAGAALLVNGMGQAGFSVMQATLVYLAAPPEMRSRVLGVLTLCIGVGPVGFLHIGLLAEWLGAPTACIISGVEGLLALALTWRVWRPILVREENRPS